MKTSGDRGPKSSAGDPRLHIVGVGASAGGLEALRELIEHVDDRSMAFVVVQHLAPEHETMMDQIMARHTTMTVELVHDGVEVEAGHLYLIPPGKEMIISGGKLLLTDRDRNEHPNLPIDTFFRSLAQELRERAIAIVLSGTGQDGSRGIRTVHEAGGLTIAQTPATAQFDSMPRAAIETGCVDLELSPSKMARALARYGQVESEGGSALSTAAPKRDLQSILDTLRQRSGIDFRQYKDSTILRRLQRRMTLGRIDDVSEYARHIADHPDEADALYRDLLVGVTRFYRDSDAWDLLAGHIGNLVDKMTPMSEDLRVWVAGCATGPEAYTMAILFAEAFRKKKMEPRVKIFATDVHRLLLERASQGVYDDEALAAVPDDIRKRWFRETRPGASVVAPSLRDMVVFAHHDVTRDPPFTRLDLLSCRNMLIYLRPAAQQRVLTLFHFALKTSGLLLLGPSESPGKLEDEFVSIDNRWKLYRKRRDVRLRGALRQPEGIRTRTSAPNADRHDPGNRARDRLLARFAPPTILVDASGRVEHTLVGGGRFLGTPDGAFSQNLLDLVKGQLRTAVSAATHRAWHKGVNATYRDVAVRVDGEDRMLDVIVEPMTPEAGDQSPLLVSFVLQGTTPDVSPRPRDTASMAQDRVNALEDQLAVTKENLQAALEEMETSNEELQATNEELIASNEELQSTNEELSSVNEELVTVNVEHKEKIAELQAVTADLENLMSSTEVHVLFLDHELRIRRFTSLAGELFRLRKSDLDRPIQDFRHRFVDQGNLLQDMKRALLDGEASTRDLAVSGSDDRYLVRVLPYHLEGHIQGVVVTLLDVTVLREAQQMGERMAAVMASTPDLIATASPEGQLLDVNAGGRAMLGFDGDSGIPAKFEEFFPADVRTMIKEEAIPAALEKGSWLGDSVLLRADGREVPVSQLILSHHDERTGERFLSTIARDMTELAEHARRLEEADRRKDVFLATLSHELRNPLHAIHTAMQLLERNGAGMLDRAAPVITRQVANLERLLEDLLDVSRITAGQVVLRRKKVVLRDILQPAVEAVRTSNPEANISVDVPDDLDLVADPTRLEQMVGNLLSNAVKYSPEGSPVKVHASNGGLNVDIAVEDVGEGLEDSDLEHIFEPFVRETGRTEKPGLGLGLALVRQLARLHGGEIRAFSDGTDQGSRFVLSLPREQQRPPSSDRMEMPRRTANGKCVLVVDDNADAAAMLGALLEAEGHEVHTATTLAEGFEAVERLRPQIALVDIGLPDGSGLDMARELEESELRPPDLIAVSGYGQAADIKSSLDAGFNAHAVKPVGLDQLRRLLSPK